MIPLLKEWGAKSPRDWLKFYMEMAEEARQAGRHLTLSPGDLDVLVSAYKEVLTHAP